MIEVAARLRLGAFALDAAFAGPGHGVTVLFGPSGSGKSTLLAIIGGALAPEQGRVAIGPQVLTDTAAGRFVPPERRRIGWVYQDARLFPHLSVDANLRYGLRRAGGVPRITVAEVTDVLAIGHLLQRRPRDLSGGERQRVALGRALLSQPALLLLDEPLAALDAALKAEILPFIAALRDRFDLPMVYVTHAEAEALALGDHLVRIDQGRVTAEGRPSDHLAAARFSGEVVAPGQVVFPGLTAPVGSHVDALIRTDADGS